MPHWQPDRVPRLPPCCYALRAIRAGAVAAASQPKLGSLPDSINSCRGGKDVTQVPSLTRKCRLTRRERSPLPIRCQPPYAGMFRAIVELQVGCTTKHSFIKFWPCALTAGEA